MLSKIFWVARNSTRYLDPIILLWKRISRGNPRRTESVLCVDIIWWVINQIFFCVYHAGKRFFLYIFYFSCVKIWLTFIEDNDTTASTVRCACLPINYLTARAENGLRRIITWYNTSFGLPRRREIMFSRSQGGPPRTHVK